jgi:hypothetical protein
MTLTVSVRLKDGTWVEPEDPHNDLFGFEQWRTTVWGSDEIRALGATLLPSLSTTGVFAEGDDLDRLDRELQSIAENIKDLATKLRVREDSLLFRVENARHCVYLARQLDGTVVIW